MQQTTDRLDAALPQLQCGQCGYKGCAPYAKAIAEEQEGIDRCAPGGLDVLAALANITQQAQPAQINPQCLPAPSGGTALIDETWCIGCTKCLVVCPTDAIIGANKLMHTVIAAACTGCDLCLPVCPVDCITMIPRENPLNEQEQIQSRRRAHAKRSRLAVTTTLAAKAPEIAQDKKQALLSGILAKLAAPIAKP